MKVSIKTLKKEASAQAARVLYIVLYVSASLLTAHADGVELISAGTNHTCITTSSGGVKCWGLANLGRLGVQPSDGAINSSTPDPRNTPLDVPTLSSNIAVVSLGGDMSCAESTGLVMKCWGDNSYGQLGTGSTEKYSYVPTEVKDLGGAAFVSVGKSSACALTSMAGIKCWGRNNYGQVGDGSLDNRSQPTAVVGIALGSAADVSVGDDHACAVVGGGVKCWGRNNLGQLGNGSTADSKVPVSVNGVSQVLHIYAGAGVSYATTPTGVVKMWGWGKADATDFTALGSNIAALALGDLHGCALTFSGGVRCWGSNSRGQLGDGTQTDRQTPVDVVGLTSDVIGIAAGKEHTCALKANGQVLCWGAGSSGQLGGGSSTLKDSALAPQGVSTQGSVNPTASPTVSSGASSPTGTPTDTMGGVSTPTAATATPQPTATPVVVSTPANGMPRVFDFSPGAAGSMIQPIEQTAAGLYMIAKNQDGDTYLLLGDGMGNVTPLKRLYPNPESAPATDSTGISDASGVFFTIPTGFAGAGEKWYTNGRARGTLRVPCSGWKFKDGSRIYYGYPSSSKLGYFDLSTGEGNDLFVNSESYPVHAVVNGVPVSVSVEGHIYRYDTVTNKWEFYRKIDIRVTNRERFPEGSTFYIAGEQTYQVCAGTTCRTAYRYKVYRITSSLRFGFGIDELPGPESTYDIYTRAYIEFTSWRSSLDGKIYWIFYIPPYAPIRSPTLNETEQAKSLGFKIRVDQEPEVVASQYSVYATDNQLFVQTSHGKVTPHRSLTWNKQVIVQSSIRVVNGQIYVFGSTASEGAEVWSSTIDECLFDDKKLLAGACGCGVAESDTDRDGTMDCVDLCKSDPLKTEPGQCGCGMKDEDPDGDGKLSCKEECPNDPRKIVGGICGCGFADTDTDADGKADCVDSCAADPNKFSPGNCGCGVPDTDSDSDGTKDCLDQCPQDAGKSSPGVCGCGAADRDSDGDGAMDCQDQCIWDRAKTAPGVCGCGKSERDSDGDGIVDCQDECPQDPEKTSPGIAGCGQSDKDTDADGAPDVTDGCPNDKGKLQPGACGCGAVDEDTDADSVFDCVDQCPKDSKKSSPGTCGCGVAETDSDKDGSPDCADQCLSDPKKNSPGWCGCGISDVDSDGDGMVDCQEACNGDPRKFFPGECGCGIPDTDANSNGTVDCKDVQPSLSGPSITSKSRVIKVSFPPDGSMSYQYSFKFLDKKGRVLKKGTSKVNWGSQLSFAAPSKATNFVISYLAKGPGFKDYQSPEFSKAVK